LKRGDELTLHLDSAAFEGKNIARVNGLVAFVKGGVPGDDVRVRITRTKKTFVEADVLEVIQPSAIRTTPRCRYVGTCGGCKWQEVDYQAQLDFKRQHVVDALERIGGFSGIAVNPTLGSPDIYFYRNKMEFSFGARWLTREEMESDVSPSAPEAHPRQTNAGQEIDRFALGLHIPERFDKVLDIEECWLQSEISREIVNTVRAFCRNRNLDIYSTFTHNGYLRNLVIRQSKHTGELMVNLVTLDDRPVLMQELCTELLRAFPSITTFINNITERKSQVAIGDREVVYHGPGTITEKIGKRTYRISANSFFQTNTLQAERLYDVAKRMAALEKGDVVFDLYSGTGTIAFHVADDAAEVVGIESVESAVEDARRNAEANCVENCSFILGDLKDRLTKDTAWLVEHPYPSVMIIDPPRSGMHEKVVKQVLELAPRRIVYVSCNPATQARDLKLMTAAGQYAIKEVQPVDMFPHTYHIENVVLLEAVVSNCKSSN
jgi:23S rRNA (uracil1939-C5)-methyltransferase